MPLLWTATKAMSGEAYIKAIRLGEVAVAPELKWPLPLLPFIGTVDRSTFALQEQRLGSNLATLAPMVNEMIGDPNDTRWGWFAGGWSRPGSEEMPYNARTQESVADLAWFYTQDRSWNPYYNDERVFEALLAGIRYYIQLQRPDGGLTENSATTSTLAPVTFAIDRLGWTYMLLASTDIKNAEWNTVWKDRLKTFLIELVTWFLDENNPESWEDGVNFSNQMFSGIAGCVHIHSILPAALQTKYMAALDTILEVGTSSAGYFYENYGVDFGYTAEVALPDLAYIHEVTNHAGVAAALQHDFSFLGYNYLLEPDGRGYVVNGSVNTRQQLAYVASARSDLDGRFDLSGTARTFAPLLSAFLTTTADKSASRANWASVTSPLPSFSRGNFRSYRSQAASRVENLPTPAEKLAAQQTLPYIAQTAFTELRKDTRTGTVRYNRNYLYVKRPGYYTGVYFGYRNDQMRSGLNFLYHPTIGTIICAQPGNQVTWGLRRTDGYTDHATELTTTSTIPTGSTTFTLNLQPANNASQRDITFGTNVLTCAVSTTGSFYERIPLIIWPGVNAQIADQLSVTLANGTTQSVTDDEFIGSVTSVTLLRANRGQVVFTFDQARSITISPAAPDTNILFHAAARVMRYIDVTASNTISYTISTATA